jgi:hypothetical protein
MIRDLLNRGTPAGVGGVVVLQMCRYVYPVYVPDPRAAVNAGRLSSSCLPRDQGFIDSTGSVVTQLEDGLDLV